MQAIYTGFTILTSLAALTLLFDRFAPMTAARIGFALERRLSGLRLRSASVPGFDMPYLEGGKGETLVLIHGFGGDKDNFTRTARFLTPHYRVICPDLPGFGDASRDPAASYTIAEQVERLRALLDQIAPGPIHLGGNSMGGFIAARFAAVWPERVASLWLLDPAGTAAAHDSAVLRHYHHTGEMPLLLRSQADVAILISTTTQRRPFLPHCVCHALGQRAIADLVLHTKIMQQLVAAPLLEDLKGKLAPPTLVVWGERDQILSPAGAQATAVLCERSQTIRMPGIGHLPMLEAPRRSARDYLAFRRSHFTTANRGHPA